MADPMTTENEKRVVTKRLCPECGDGKAYADTLGKRFCTRHGRAWTDWIEMVEFVPKQELTQAEERGRVLVEALRELVRLKDGPRDDAYRAQKVIAWQEAREALDSSTGSR